MGRPKLDQADRRGKRIALAVTERDWALLNLAATIQGHKSLSGWLAEKAIEDARAIVLADLGVKP